MRNLRVVLLLIATLSPLYWIVFRVTSPTSYDPLWSRVVISAVAAALLAASFVVAGIRTHARAVLVVVVNVLLMWFARLVVANDFAGDYALGYGFVMLAAALVYAMAWDRPAPMAAALGGSILIGLVASLMADPEVADVSPLMFMLVLASGSVIVYFAFYGRLIAAHELRASEARLSKAEMLARTGSWTLNLVTGRRVWSDGAYDILGVRPSDDDPPSLLDIIVPDDLPASTAEMNRLLAEGTTSDHRFRIARPDGEVRSLRNISELVRDKSGAAVGFQGVFLDITEQVAREMALARARDVAEAATRVQSEFLSNMSHEIRTPLTAIIGFAQLLQEEVSEENAFLVEPIESGGRRLLATLNSVLDLARMEAGETDLSLVVTDAASEVAGVARLLRPLAEGKGLTLRCTLPPDPVPVLADPAALGRVLTNLLSNAIKFTDAGEVSVTLRHAGDTAEIDVADTGRGMTEAFLAELFEPFRQASTGWARSEEGTGLGLTIARRLVEAMHGAIRVESRPGQGTRFTVALALAPDGDGSARPSARLSVPAPAAG